MPFETSTPVQTRVVTKSNNQINYYSWAPEQAVKVNGTWMHRYGLGKRLPFSKSQYKNVKFSTADFCDLKDLEILKKKNFICPTSVMRKPFLFGPDQRNLPPDLEICLRILIRPYFWVPDRLPHGFFRMTEEGCCRWKLSFFKISKSFNSQKYAVKNFSLL